MLSIEQIVLLDVITKDPETSDFMLVIKYASGGDLYNYLQENFTALT